MHAFDVLGDPVRRRILELPADGEHTADSVSEVIQRECTGARPVRTEEETVIGVTQEIIAVRRQVTGRVLEAGTARVITLSRSYPAELADVWGRTGSPSPSTEPRKNLS